MAPRLLFLTILSSGIEVEAVIFCCTCTRRGLGNTTGTKPGFNLLLFLYFQRHVRIKLKESSLTCLLQSRVLGSLPLSLYSQELLLPVTPQGMIYGNLTRLTLLLLMSEQPVARQWFAILLNSSAIENKRLSCALARQQSASILNERSSHNSPLHLWHPSQAVYHTGF